MAAHYRAKSTATSAGETSSPSDPFATPRVRSIFREPASGTTNPFGTPRITSAQPSSSHSVVSGYFPKGLFAVSSDATDGD